MANVHPNDGGKPGWDDVILAGNVLSAWVDIMLFAANNVKAIANQARINNVDRQNLAVQAGLITQGIITNAPLIPILERMNVREVSAPWDVVSDAWNNINQQNPETQKQKVSNFVTYVEDLIPVTDNLQGQLRAEEARKGKTKADFLMLRNNAIRDLPNIMALLQRGLTIMPDNKDGALKLIRGQFHNELSSVEGLFYMFGDNKAKDDNDVQVRTALTILTRITRPQNEWTPQSELDCSKFMTYITERLQKFVSDPVYTG